MPAFTEGPKKNFCAWHCNEAMTAIKVIRRMLGLVMYVAKDVL